MTDYLSYKFEDSTAFVETFDEAPLWSAAFGLMLLKHLEYRPNLTILDIGSGTGFPLMEIAGRFGSTCTFYGIDPWHNANLRAELKVKRYGLKNVHILETSAASIALDDNSIDLIVSNLGINNFEEPGKIFKECKRLLKPGGRLALTTNVNGHWKEFYTVFEDTARQLGNDNLLLALVDDQARRGDPQSIARLYTDAGLQVTRHATDTFEMNFADGSAMLNHHFVKVGWLGSWIKMVPEDERQKTFTILEHNLNQYAQHYGSLKLTVPMLFMEGVK